MVVVSREREEPGGSLFRPAGGGDSLREDDATGIHEAENGIEETLLRRATFEVERHGAGVRNGFNGLDAARHRVRSGSRRRGLRTPPPGLARRGVGGVQGLGEEEGAAIHGSKVKEVISDQ
jgi:hypothetical protein